MQNGVVVFQWLRPKCQTILGIDINPTSIQLVEIAYAKKASVKTYGYFSLPLGIMDGYWIKDIHALAHSLKKIIKTLSVTAKNAVIAIPDSAVIKKTLELPTELNEEELAELVLTEANKYLTNPTQKILFDFVIRGKSKKEKKLNEVICFFARSENIARLQEAFQIAGIGIKLIEIKSLAIERASQSLIKNLPVEEAQTILVINFNGDIIEIFAFADRVCVYHNEEPYFHNTNSPSIAFTNQKNIDNLDIDIPLETENNLEEKIIFLVKKNLKVYYSNTSNQINHIFVAGDIQNNDVLVNNIFNAIKIPTSFVYFIKKKKVPSLLTAYGLALRKENA